MASLLLMVLFTSFSYSQDQTEELPDFSLMATNGQIYTQSDYENKKLMALVFISNHCKVSQLFQNHLNNLSIKFEKEAVILAISPNYEKAILPDELAYSDLGDSLEDMRKRAKRMNYKFPYLYDGNRQYLTQALGVKITPSVFLYNEKRKLVYAGRIGNTDTPDQMETSELNMAILRALGENKIVYKRTKVFGTAIKTKEDLSLAEDVKKRYADESVKLTYADERKLEFYLNHKTNKPKLFYVWQATDKNVRDNLIKLSFLFKIFRKRGLKLITICISEKQDEKEILDQLEKAQLSSINFMCYGHEVAPLAKIIPLELEKVTPYYRLLGSEGNMLIGKHGDIMKDTLRLEILRALNKSQ